MKYPFILFCFILSLTADAQNVYTPFPSYREVTAIFFEKYSMENSPEGAKTRFEKRPDGWHVTYRDNSAKTKVLKDALLWNADTKSFIELTLIRRKDGENNDVERELLLKQWETPYYDACPYYGYSGWDWDVVKQFESYEGLPDTILFGVGRAYSLASGNLLNDNSGYSDSARRYVLKEGKNSLSTEQLKEYRLYRHKAIDIYKKLEKINPDFETVVGSIGLKSAHEHVSTFLDLRMYQNEVEALKELPDNIYQDFIISLAMNYLNSCTKNAILFVNGDTDTFPLLYVQAKNKFRPDVMVVNVSMLQSDRYINHLREKILDADGLPFSITAAELKTGNREYIYLKEDKDRIWDIEKAIKYMRDNKNILKQDDFSYLALTGNAFSAKIDGKRIKWRLPFDVYFYKNSMMMLDLIANYNPARPLYFAQTLEESLFLGLGNYVAMEGLAYRLGGEFLKTAEGPFSQINVSRLYHNLMTDFAWKGNETVHRLEKPNIFNYTRQFYWLSRRLIDNNEPIKAREVLTKYFTLFPDSYFPFDYYTLDLLENYYLLNEPGSGNRIGKAILANIKARKINIPTKYNNYSEMEYNDATIAKLRKLIVTYQQEDFFAKLW